MREVREVEKEREVSEESPLVLQDASPLCNEMPLWGRSTFKSEGRTRTKQEEEKEEVFHAMMD